MGHILHASNYRPRRCPSVLVICSCVCRLSEALRRGADFMRAARASSRACRSAFSQEKLGSSRTLGICYQQAEGPLQSLSGFGAGAGGSTTLTWAFKLFASDFTGATGSGKSRKDISRHFEQATEGFSAGFSAGFSTGFSTACSGTAFGSSSQASARTHGT